MMLIAFVARHLFCFVLLLFLCAPQVKAQVEARCLPGWEWARNSFNQDPCEVLALLESQCLGFRVGVPALDPPSTVGYTYPNSGSSWTLQCECNVPVFNIIQACVDCQGGNTTAWGLWTEECPNVYQVLQFSVPQGSAVPRWAFVGNAGTDFIFLDTFAMSIGRDPEATPGTTGPSTVVASSFSTASSSSLSATVLPMPTSTLSSVEPVGPTGTPDEGGGSKSNTGIGIIIGTSIGGSALFIAVIVLALLYARRRRMKKEEALSQAMLKTPPPVSQMPAPFVYTRTKVLPVTPLHSFPESPYTIGSSDAVPGSRRLVVVNPSDSPTSSTFSRPNSRVLGGVGDTNTHPVHRPNFE